MTYEEFLHNLAVDQLSNTNYISKPDYTIKEEFRDIITAITNRGLVDLYTKFPIKTKEVLIQCVPHITFYYLRKQYSESQGNPDTHPIYIMDLMNEPFDEDVLSIQSIVSGGTNKEVPLNDTSNIDSLFTPEFDLIQVNNPMFHTVLNVVYRAKPSKITELSDVIYLNDNLINALLYYVSYRLFSNINTQENITRSQEYLMMYNSICNESLNQGIVLSSNGDLSDKFHRLGWV